MSQYDISSLYSYLAHTPEGGLRKMLVDAKFTEVHFNLLVKVVRACSETQFVEHFEKNDFPKVKLGAAEIKIKENFWKDCETCFNGRGLLAPAQKAA